MTCESCGAVIQIGEWPFCPHGFPFTGLSIVDDQIDGGPRFFETLGHDPVWIESKSQLKREAAARNLENVVRHDDAYYQKRLRMANEEQRDTGRHVEY